MKASIVDLRYHMNEVLKALERNQMVTIMYHGKEKGVIIPSGARQKAGVSVRDTELFGMYSSDTESVDEIMSQLRGGRHDDI